MFSITSSLTAGASHVPQTIERLRTTGPLATAQRNLYRGAWNAFEKWNRLDTGGSIHAQILGNGPSTFGYQPIDYHTMLGALRHVRVHAFEDVFVDYGCGKGRACLLAACRAFRKVIGVECSASLCEIARQNILRSRRWQRCRDVEIVHADATEYRLPDDATVLFFYNPFSGDVLQRVLAQISQSLLRRWRKMRIIYALPKVDDDALEHCEWLKQTACLRTFNSDWQKVSIYEPRAVAFEELIP